MGGSSGQLDMNDSDDKDTLSAVYYGVKRLEDDVRDIKQILVGNGKPDRGLVVRFSKVEHSVGSFRKLFWILVGVAVSPTIILAIVKFLIK